MFSLSPAEYKKLKPLNTPIKIQNFLDTLKVNFEKNGDTLRSPREVLKRKEAHCIEGALLAALALYLNGRDPLLLDLKADNSDYDHVVALYKVNGYWGAISKSNHATLRFRDPVYKTLRELALSYFHEYFVNKTGKKSLISYSRPLNLKRLDKKWMVSEKNLWYIALALDNLPHHKLVGRKMRPFIRPADKMERKAGTLVEWKKR